MTNIERLENEMLEMGIITEETLQVVYAINGYKLETTKDILHAKTGFESLEQLREIK